MWGNEEDRDGGKAWVGGPRRQSGKQKALLVRRESTECIRIAM